MAKTIGFLHSGSKSNHSNNYLAFERGLAEAGYVDDDDINIKELWADDDLTTLQTNAAKFVNPPIGPVDVIVAAGGPRSAAEAKNATPTIPIVFTVVSDPVRNSLIQSYENPGYNLTGTAGLTSELDPKRLEILKELLPNASTIGVLKNPIRPTGTAEYQDLTTAATKLGLTLVPKDAKSLAEIQNAFTGGGAFPPTIDAILVTADQLFNNQRRKLVKLVRQFGKPAIYQWRDFVDVRGLMSYGPSITDAYFKAGIYVGRVLDGGTPANMPVMFPDKFELVINLKTAHHQSVNVPVSLLTRAILVRKP